MSTESPVRTSAPTREEALAVERAPQVPRSIAAARFALPSLLLLFIAFFWIARPETFGTSANLETILTTQSVLAILALATTLPLILGEFDISVGAVLGLGGVLVAGFATKTGLPVPVAVLLSLAVCTGVGVINGILVARVGVTSIVATLGISSIVSGAVLWYTGGSAIFEDFPQSLSRLGQNELFGVALPVYYLLVIAVVVWYVLEHTALGRYLYAIGGSKEASRLSGVNVGTLTILTFAATGFLAGLAGVISASQLAAGNPDVGPPYLLAAFAAAFLGATAFKRSTYNVLGTVVAVFTIAVGTTGLQLMGVPFFVEPIFTGVALVIAVTATRILQRESL